MGILWDQIGVVLCLDVSFCYKLYVVVTEGGGVLADFYELRGDACVA